jgi:hypothetical protein
MTKIIRAATLELALSICAQAGIIQFDRTEPPPPPPPAMTSTTQDETDLQTTTDETTQTDLAKDASQAMLGVLQSLSALF